MDIVSRLGFLLCHGRPHPYGPMQIKVRNIERQEVGLDIVGQVAIRFVHTTQVIEITSLSEWARLIRIPPVDSWLTS